jgi:hypothetical protein
LKEFDWFWGFLPWLPTWVFCSPKAIWVGEGGFENEKNSHLSIIMYVVGSFASFRFG